jgi:hypothetical protein
MLRAVRMPLEGLEEEAACYASPEFEAYGPLQKQVDVYGVGAVLYGLLTLRAPTGCFVRPSNVRPGLSRALDQIVLRALDEDPDERYDTPFALAGALEGLWVLGTHRHELETAADRLSATGSPKGVSAREGRVWTSRRILPKREDRTAQEAPAMAEPFSLALSDRLRAVCLVLLTLLNLGLFLEAVMEAGSYRGGDFSNSKDFLKWESMFSDAGVGGPADRTGAG